MTEAELVIAEKWSELEKEGKRISMDNGGFIRPSQIDMKAFYDFCTEFSEKYGPEGDKLLRRYLS